MLATEYADYYGIAPQQPEESDYDFRHRVAGKLRDMGKIIEAHEAQRDERIEQSDDVMQGVVGAIAQVLHGIDYGVSGVQQVGCDIAAGAIAKSPRPETDRDIAMLTALLLAEKP